jgi:hypothetical protein
MSLNIAFANYNGKQPNNTAYIKNFVAGTPISLWKAIKYPLSNGTTVGAVTTTSKEIDNVVIPGNLYVNGSIINPSDINLKDNIREIDDKQTIKLMNLKATEFTFKSDETKHVHYGFIAQEFEKEYPELVSLKPDISINNLKAINYLEIIPLLVSKVQEMQKEIDILREQVNNK